MRILFGICAFVLLLGCGGHHSTTTQPRVVRCAVIGGMTMTGLWPRIAQMFEAESGYKTELVMTGPRPELDKAMREGKVDLLTMHSGDITTDLVADVLPGEGAADIPVAGLMTKPVQDRFPESGPNAAAAGPAISKSTKTAEAIPTGGVAAAPPAQHQ